MDKICTILVTYNAAKWIEKCIQHLLNSNLSSTIIIIDNGSTDNTIDLLQSFSSGIELIENEKNLGFGAANNIGIKRAIELNAAFIFLLNQDVYVSENCIGALVAALKNYPSFGIISPLQLNKSGQQLDESFKKNLKRSFSEEELKKLMENKFQTTITSPVSVRFVNAAAWMMSKNAIGKVGLFHPAFYHYGEDNNYSSRLQYHRLKMGISLAATVIHDRNEEKATPEKLLIRKLKTVPFYTLLDIRKPLPIAYFFGFLKLRSIKKKFGKNFSNDINLLYEEQKEWFNKKLKKAIQIRRETKKTSAKFFT